MASPFSWVLSDLGALLFRYRQYHLESDYVVTHTWDLASYLVLLSILFDLHNTLVR